jgi:hypothetical protein
LDGEKYNHCEKFDKTAKQERERGEEAVACNLKVFLSITISVMHLRYEIVWRLAEKANEKI